MPDATFACPKCQAVFGVEVGKDHIAADCPECASSLEAFFFPALFRERKVGAPALALVDHTETSCFYHGQKQAVGVCDGCGRFVCALCSIDMGDQHLCPNCIASGKKKGRLTTLENSRTRYDNIALGLAVVGCFAGLIWCGIPTLIAAPCAIYISIRHWKSQGSLLGVSRTRFILAIIISVLALCFFAAMLILVIFGASLKHHH